MIRIVFSNNDERESILDKQTSQGYVLIREENLLEGNYLVFGEPRDPTPEERIKALEEERLGLQLALAESIEKQEIDKINNQLALADLVETLTMKGVL